LFEEKEHSGFVLVLNYSRNKRIVYNGDRGSGALMEMENRQNANEHIQF